MELLDAKAEASNGITGEIYQRIDILVGHITVWNYSMCLEPCDEVELEMAIRRAEVAWWGRR